jgi:hypothetical protein
MFTGLPLPSESDAVLSRKWDVCSTHKKTAFLLWLYRAQRKYFLLSNMYNLLISINAIK